MQRIFSMELAGRTITAETGKYAEQAGGSVLMRCGDTAVLVCATVAKAPRDGVVAGVHVTANSSVEAGKPLVSLQ